MTDEEFNRIRKEIHVCDHAVLRYTQRILGMNTDYVNKSLMHNEKTLIRWLNKKGLINIQSIKNDILDYQLINLVDLFGPDGYYRTKKYLVVMKSGKVVTIIK